MTPIKCMAVDDEPLALGQLVSYIKRVPFLELVAPCEDALDAMNFMAEKQVDLLFIDINMPDMNGLDFVRSLKKKPYVVFTTAYSEYAVEGFKVEAVDYLLKPYSFSDFLAAADKVRKRMEEAEALRRLEANGGSVAVDGSGTLDCQLVDNALFVKNDYRITRVELDDILYIESLSEYVRIYLESQEKPLMPLLSMRRLEATLPSNVFMRIHRSYIVNLHKIKEISRLRIIFGKTIIPIGEAYKEKFLEYVDRRTLK